MHGSQVGNCIERIRVLKVPDPKSLINEFSLKLADIHGEKIANMYLICKQFEKIMLMLLIVL